MNRKELMKSLEKLYPAVATKAPVEEMECFRFTDHSITSTDGLVQVQVTLPGSTGLDCAVPARKLYTLLGSISQDDISLDLQENEFSLVFNVKNKFAGELLKKEKVTLSNILSETFGLSVKIHISFNKVEQNDQDQKDQRVEILKNVFQGEVIKEE